MLSIVLTKHLWVLEIWNFYDFFFTLVNMGHNGSKENQNGYSYMSQTKVFNFVPTLLPTIFTKLSWGFLKISVTNV